LFTLKTDALILTSAIELGCAVLWTEDFSDGQRLGPITIRNPFRQGGPEPAASRERLAPARRDRRVRRYIRR
jgi:hypothetical protein